MKNNRLYIILSTIVTILLLYIVDQVLLVSYVQKACIKIVLFGVFPILYLLKNKENFLKDSFKGVGKKKRIIQDLVLGCTIFILIYAIYYIMQSSLDQKTIVEEFGSKYQIDKTNIIYYSLYITFINSFMEEFFFRGFVFLNLKKNGNKRLGYFFSSIAFAIYHIANFQNWVSIGAFAVISLGLFVGGIIFNYLDDRTNSFVSSWSVHIFADLSIVFIGLKIFEII